MKALVFSRKPAKFAAAMVAGPARARRRRQGRPALAARRRSARAARPGLGAACGPGSRASAAPTWPPSTAPRRAGSSRSCRSRSRPATRWSATSTTASARVVVPVLSCVARGIAPVCPPCAEGRINHCERIGFGDLEPGLQCGFCESTGGGWSTLMVAHESQLVAVPDDLSDEAAVLVEPTACAVHAAAQVDAGQRRAHRQRHPRPAHHRRPAPRAPGGGAHRHRQAPPPARAGRRARRRPGGRPPASSSGPCAAASGTMRYDNGQLGGGADAVVDCVGLAPSRIAQALRIAGPGRHDPRRRHAGRHHRRPHPAVAARGRAARRLRLPARRLRRAPSTSSSALDLGRLVTATYPLRRYEDAIAHAATAGARGAVKIAFDLRSERERDYI